MKPSILLVEDEPIIALRETTVLKKSGYQITHVPTGEDAVALIEQDQEFDLILMDLDLGSGISGTEAAKRILNHKMIPLAFLSSHTEPKIVEQAQSIGSYGYIVKHSGDTVLLTSIKMALALAKSHRENRQMDVQVRESRDLLKTMFDSLSDGLVVMDRQFRIIQANKWVEDRYGSFSEILGTKCHRVFQQDDHQCSFCPIRETLHKDTNWKGLVPVTLPNGGRGWYDISIKSLYGPDGDHTGYVEHLRDVTLQKISEEQLQKSTTAQQLLLDLSSRLMGCNQQTKEESLGTVLSTMGNHLGYHQVTILSSLNHDAKSPDPKSPDPRQMVVQQWQATNPGALHRIPQGRFHQMIFELLESPEQKEPYYFYGTQDLSEGELKHQLRDHGSQWLLIVPLVSGHQVPHQGAIVAEYQENPIDLPDHHRMILLSLVQMILTFQDRWQYQKVLEESEARTKLLADLTIEAVIIHTDGLAIMVNKSFCNLFGYEEKEILGRKIDFMVHPEDFAYVREQMLKEHAPPYEARFFHKHKTIIWVEIEARNFTLDGKTMRVAALRDIRERKDDQNRIRSMLTEKETLLREVHHRIKNNMATMMGILSLQADAMEDKSASLALLDARGRMQSMSVLYEKLYHGANLEALSMRAYLTSLVEEVLGLYGRQDISTRLEIEDITLPVEVLSPLGILCNEIFTNSIKHGFQGANHPQIGIRFQIQDTLGILEIQEQGARSTGVHEPKDHEGFGLVLIQALTEQLNAKRLVDKQLGWTYRFEIPLDRYLTNL